MTITKLALSAVLFAVALAACGDEENPTVAKVDETIAKARNQAVEEYRSALQELQEKWKKISADYEAATPEKREELADDYGAILEKKAAAEKKLKTLADADADDWDDARDDFDETWRDLSESVDEFGGKL